MFWGPNNSLARAPKGQQIIFRVQGPRVQDSWPDLFLSCQNSCQLLFISCAADVNIMSNEVVFPFLYESLLSSLSLIFTMLCICMCVCVCVCCRRCWSRVRLVCLSSSCSSSRTRQFRWKTQTRRCCWENASTSCWPSSPSSWCACPRLPSSPPRCCAAEST